MSCSYCYDWVSHKNRNGMPNTIFAIFLDRFMFIKSEPGIELARIVWNGRGNRKGSKAFGLVWQLSSYQRERCGLGKECLSKVQAWTPKCSVGASESKSRLK